MEWGREECGLGAATCPFIVGVAWPGGPVMGSHQVPLGCAHQTLATGAVKVHTETQQ